MMKDGFGSLDLFWLTGIIAGYFAIDIFQNTFISQLACQIAFVSIAFIFFIFIRNKIPSFLRQIFVSLAASSFLMCLFLEGNYWGKAQATNRRDYIITGKGEFVKGRNGCGQPYIIINNKSQEKQIVFNCDDKPQISIANSVQLGIAKGLFGFDVIVAKTLH